MIFNVNSGKGKDENLLPENIKNGVVIDDVIGTYKGSVTLNNPVCARAESNSASVTKTITVPQKKVSTILFEVVSNSYMSFVMIFNPNDYNQFAGYVININKEKSYDATSYITHTVSGSSHTFLLEYSDLYNASYDGGMLFSRDAQINLTINENGTVVFNYPTKADYDKTWHVSIF